MEELNRAQRQKRKSAVELARFRAKCNNRHIQVTTVLLKKQLLKCFFIT